MKQGHRLSFVFSFHTVKFQTPSVRNKILFSYQMATDVESIFRKGDTKLKLQGVLHFKIVLGNASVCFASPKDRYMKHRYKKDECLVEEICILGNLSQIEISIIAYFLNVYHQKNINYFNLSYSCLCFETSQTIYIAT